MRLRRPSPLAALLVALAASAACFPGAPLPLKAPPAPVHGELGPRAAPLPVPSEHGPLGVVFAAPRGEVSSAENVTIVFDKPMRRLGEDGRDGKPPVVLAPEVPGSFRWIGSSTLRFDPAKPFPKATTFRVAVPLGTKAADGTALAAAYEWSFSTPRPSLTGSEPVDGATAVGPDSTITLFFSAPIEKKEIERAVSIDARGRVPFSILELEGDRVVLAPRGPLPKNANVKVHVDASLRGAEGELPAGKDVDIHFRTVGPFSVASLDCAPHPTEKGACNPEDGGVTLSLTTPAQDELIGPALSIDPAPDWFNVAGSYEDAEGSRTFQLTGDFKPGKTYTVELRSRAGGRPLTDVHGQVLTKGEKKTFHFGDLPASVLFGADGMYWAPGKRFLPIGVTNAEDTTVSILPLSREHVLARLAGGEWPASPASPLRTFAATAGKRNEPAWSRFRVEELLPTATTSGPVLVRGSYRASAKPDRSTLDREVQLTDLGLFGKIAPSEVLSWVTRLSDGMAPPNTHVEAFYVEKNKKPILLGAADADPSGLAGMAMKIPHADGDENDDDETERQHQNEARIALFARSGDDWAYQTFRAPRRPLALGSVFTGRGVYRPGEEVEVKGVLRIPDASGLTTPRSREIELRVLDTERAVVHSVRKTLSRFGTFSATLPIAEGAPLGFYQLEARLDGAIVKSWFSVDEYHPIESKVHATVDAATHMHGDRMVCSAHGEWLHGAPMAGAKASIVVTRVMETAPIKVDHGFTVGEHDATAPTGQIAQGSGTLDATGTFSLPISLALPGQTGAAGISCTVEVRGQTGEVQTDFAGTIVHNADHYIALEADERYEILPGDAVEPRVLAVKPDGKRLKEPVHIEVFRRAHPDGYRIDDRLVGQCDVKTDDSPVGCKIKIPDEEPAAGDEIVVRATARDSTGRRVASSYAIRLEPKPVTVKPEPASPSPPPPPPPPPPAPDPPRLGIKMKESYKVGEAARIELTSPYLVPSSALLTVEREGILFRRVVPLAPHGKITTVDMPITPGMVPNGMFTVTTFSNERTETDSTEFEVDAKDRALSVTVSPSKTSTAPGDTIDVEVLVADAAGKPVANAEVTLWGADEGTLMVGRYRTPEPWYRFFAPRDALVDTNDGRRQLLRTWSGDHRTRPPQVRMGATSVGPHRGDFRQTVAFFPDLVTDARGRVKRKITLPDGLTAYRFMAVAVTEGDYTGSGEEHVKTWKPLMARPTLPHVLRAGDEFEAEVALSTIDLPEGDVTVTTSAKGLAAAGPNKKTAKVTPDQPAVLRFPLRAERNGKVAFSVEASMTPTNRTSPETDGVDLSGEIASPAPLEAASISGETASAIAERLSDLGELRPDTGGLSISLSTSPLTGLASGIEQLVEYPYGCTEQTVSRMVPLLSLRDLAKALGVAVLPRQTTKTRAESPDEALLRGTRAVLANQRRDGSFGLWPGSSEGDPWITAYALWGLGEAKRRGMPVPAEALERGFSFLKPNLATVGPATDSHTLGEAAFTLAVLAEQGRIDAKGLAALLSERARLPLFARALVLRTLALAGSGGTPEARSLAQDLEAAFVVDGVSARITSPRNELSSFESDVRTSAMALRALLAVDPAHPLAGKIARGLVDARRRGFYETTHDAAWALLALETYLHARPLPTDELDARVFLGNTLLADAHLGGATLQRSVEVPMADLLRGRGAPLTLSAAGGGRLFYEAVLRYSRKGASKEPVDRGFFITKSFRPVGELGGPVFSSKDGPPLLAPGDVVVCEIEVVTTSPRHWVVLTDPLPGGLEAIRLSHGRGGSWLAALEETPANRRELRDDHVAYFIDRLPAGVTRFRYLARATHIGKFSAPPTQAEEMYSPEMFGRTADTVLRIGTR